MIYFTKEKHSGSYEPEFSLLTKSNRQVDALKRLSPCMRQLLLASVSTLFIVLINSLFPICTEKCAATSNADSITDNLVVKLRLRQ